MDTRLAGRRHCSWCGPDLLARSTGQLRKRRGLRAVHVDHRLRASELQGATLATKWVRCQCPLHRGAARTMVPTAFCRQLLLWGKSRRDGHLPASCMGRCAAAHTAAASSSSRCPGFSSLRSSRSGAAPQHRACACAYRVFSFRLAHRWARAAQPKGLQPISLHGWRSYAL